MTLALLVGVGLGSGLALVASGVFPARLPLDAVIARLHVTRTEKLGITDTTSSARTRLLGRSWSATGFAQRLLAGSAADLRVVGLHPHEYLAQRATIALIGLVWAPATVALMWAGGIRAPVTLPLWVSFALAPVGFLVPSLSLRARAAQRRRTFRHAFSSFLDVVAVSLAAGAGVDSALNRAAGAGQGLAFDELRRSLTEAQLLGETPWSGLDRLGREIGVAELSELAASAALAGNEGARVRCSIAAKAKALRLRGLTDIEAAAQSASERMSLPIVMLLVGFVLFLGYPAVMQVLRGL